MRWHMVKLSCAVAIIVMMSAESGFAQRGSGRGRGSGGWGAGAEYSRLYNPKTVETLEGEVVSVDDYTPRNATGRGVHVTLKTDKESVAVHLGPAWFIERQDVQIEAKDNVKVTGSRVTYEDKPAIIAAEIEKGDEVLELRDKQGIPRWSIGRGRRMGRGSGGWGAGSEYARLYNPKTAESLDGEVVRIDYHSPRNTTGRGVHVTLKTDKESVAVHLGPEWFIENQDVQIEVKDKIRVTGSRIEYEEQPAIIAAEIERGDEVLELRDKQGFPRWAGWRRQ